MTSRKNTPGLSDVMSSEMAGSCMAGVRRLMMTLRMASGLLDCMCSMPVMTAMSRLCTMSSSSSLMARNGMSVSSTAITPARTKLATRRSTSMASRRVFTWAVKEQSHTNARAACSRSALGRKGSFNSLYTDMAHASRRISSDTHSVELGDGALRSACQFMGMTMHSSSGVRWSCKSRVTRCSASLPDRSVSARFTRVCSACSTVAMLALARKPSSRARCRDLILDPSSGSSDSSANARRAAPL
mmetsp:Transcript_22188/g.55659  ORF Transcript_22188/g.55659 Transcript_22188/m.55659 type:complete len:244 (-) Transcript_22188:382-1113(-)